jgi:protein-L-isoaspartate(D-aspartate) O-methyltransferase
MSDFLTARQNMVDGQVRPSDVTDLRIIEAMLAVPREIFVPDSRQALAYLDLDLEVSETGADKRFLLKPVVIAKLLQAAEIRDTDSVLVVGCSAGYTAALASKLAQRASATDPDRSLVAKATAALGQLGLGATAVEAAPALEGNAAQAPYDVIILDGATEVVPEGLYAQLKEGGRLVGVFAAGGLQRATIVTRSRDDFGSRTLFDATAEVSPGLHRAADFVF